MKKEKVKLVIMCLMSVMIFQGCASSRKQFVKLGEKIDSAKFRTEVVEDGVVYLAKQQVKIEKTIEDIKGDLESLKGKIPAVEKKYNYIVKKGDFLWKIANDLYRNGARWMEIYVENKELIDNVNLIFPGQQLVIPNLD